MVFAPQCASVRAWISLDHKVLHSDSCVPSWWMHAMLKVDFNSRKSLALFALTPVLTFAVLIMSAATLCTSSREGEAQSPSETAWLLEQGRGIAPEQLTGPTLTRQGLRLSGSTGCNSFTATIAATGEHVKIEDVSLTRKLCAPRRNETERAFVAALGQTEYLEEQKDRLTFFSGTREPLLIWKPNAERMLRKARMEKGPQRKRQRYERPA